MNVHSSCFLSSIALTGASLMALSSTMATLFSMPPRQPYRGPSRKIVLAFDIGTTFSGVSYSILDPGEVPQIKGVTRFPAQEHVGGDAKIPSILYYTEDGQLRAVGAEALQPSTVERAEYNGWVKVEWWKLHLHPKDLDFSRATSGNLPPLPANKSVVHILSDFMTYLFQCTRSYIQESYSAELWSSLERDIDLVLTHPNGWEGSQQGQIRSAAVLAGLISDTQDGHARLRLLTEGEASLHFCIGHGMNMKAGQGVVVVDAGGGTIDISAYTRSSNRFEEITSPECHLQGSVFVTRRANSFLQDKLAKTRFGDPEELANMTNVFDMTTKLRFRNEQEPSFIKFGGLRDKDTALGIRSGQLKISGTDMATLFEPSAKCIIDVVEQQRRAASKTIASVFLVGGFSASGWLFSRIQKYLVPFGIKVCRANSQVNKAVADGAISFYLDRLVSVRVAKWTYGTECTVLFSPQNPEHIARMDTIHVNSSGKQRVPNAFSSILVKGARVSENEEYQEDYSQSSEKLDDFNYIWAEISCYHGDCADPHWTDDEPEMFTTLCIVTADTSEMAKNLKKRRKWLFGTPYYYRNFKIILLFGLTELKAQISWIENGKEKRSPAKIVYDLSMVTGPCTD